MRWPKARASTSSAPGFANSPAVVARRFASWPCHWRSPGRWPVRSPAPLPRPPRSTASAALSVARMLIPALSDPGEADPAASIGAAYRSGWLSSDRAMSRGNTGADRTTGRCRPGRCTADEADVSVGFGQSPVGLNGCTRDDVDRSCPPHCCRVPVAQGAAPKYPMSIWYQAAFRYDCG